MKSQLASNQAVFAALRVGARFSACARNPRMGWPVIEVYTKLPPDGVVDRVQASDGRIWPLAFTQAGGGSVILVPEGAYSASEYDVTYNRDRANPFRPATGYRV